jgi:hypothetical protein
VKAPRARSQLYSLVRFPTSNCHRLVVTGGHMLSDLEAGGSVHPWSAPSRAFRAHARKALMAA